MLRWLQRIFIGHNHTWKTISTGPLSRIKDGTVVGQRYVLRCETCGRIQHYDAI